MFGSSVISSALFTLMVAGSALSLGCSDPAKDVPKATVDSARPIPASSGSAKAAASGTSNAGASTANAAPSAPEGALTLSAEGSTVGFVGSKVTGSHEGKFQKFDGWLALDGDKAESAKLYVSIDMASVKSDSEKLDKHLKDSDFFQVDTFPTSTFQSTEVKAGGEGGATHTITGNLKLRGVEKSVSFPATISIDGGEVKAKAEFSINRKDFGIEYAGKADDLIRDDVKIKLDLKIARKK